MILLPQMTCGLLLLMAGNYSLACVATQSARGSSDAMIYRRAPCHISCGKEKEMTTSLEQLQALRLLRAFCEIKDHKAREAIVTAAEQSRDAEREAADQQPAPER
jgi:hypothetical protein